MTRKILLLLMVLMILPSVNAASFDDFYRFEDDFNRADSNTVGNGWSEGNVYVNGERIASNRLYLDDVSASYGPRVWYNTPSISDFWELRYDYQYYITSGTEQFYAQVEASTWFDSGYNFFDSADQFVREGATSRHSITDNGINTGSVKFRKENGRLKAKYWSSSGSEGTNWILNGASSASYSGSIYFAGNNNGGRQIDYAIDNVVFIAQNTTGFSILPYEAGGPDFLNDVTVNLYDENMTLLLSSLASEGGQLYDLSAGNYTILLNKTGYTTDNQTVYFDGSTSQNLEFNMFEVPSVNITFYDEQTTNIITGTNLTAEFWNDNEGYTSSTTTGMIEQGLTTDGDYNIKFYGDGYATKYYFFSIDMSEYKAISLYMSNSSGLANVTATINDQNLDELEGAVLIVEKFNTNTAEYLVSERLAADFEGKVRFKAKLYDYYYKFKIYYDDELLFTSIPTTIKSESINFVVTTGRGFNGGFNDILDINYQHYFDEINNRFVFSYSNVEGGVTGIYSETNRITSTGNVLVNTTSQSSSSGTIYHTVNNITGYTYKNCVYGYTTFGQELISCETKEFDTNISDSARELSLFWLIFFTILFSMSALYNITVGLVITPIPFLLFEIIGFSTLGLPYAISVQVLFIVIAMIINK